MSALTSLADRWEQEADVLRAHGADALATTAELHARQLREAIESENDRLLTPAQAAEASGYSRRRLRELEAEGKLQNRGRKGSPRYRRGDLPRKIAQHQDAGFDPDAVASRIIGSH